MSQDLTIAAAVRGLVEAYAQAADEADGSALAALFHDDGVMRVFRDPAKPTDHTVRSGRSEISTAMEGLKAYSATTHVVGSHTSSGVGDIVTATTRCVAHHLYGSRGEQRDLVMHIRYDDRVERREQGWLFAERNIHVVALVDQPAAAP